MRIAICTDNFYPTSRGTENAVNSIASSLVSLGNEVYVFAPLKGKDDGDKKHPYKIERAYSLPVMCDEQINFPQITHRFKKELKSFAPDIIHAHTPFNVGNYCIDYAKKKNIPSVLTIHTRFSYTYDMHVPFNKNNLLHKIVVKSLMTPVKKAVAKADCVTTVSNSCIKDEINHYGVSKNVVVVRNGHSIQSNEKKQCESLTDDAIHLCFAGNISREKNIAFMLRVCKVLSDRSIPYTFDLFGEGQDEKMFKAMASKMKLLPNVSFRGKKKHKELFSLYEKKDIFLFPSIFDNDSLAAIESRSKGLITLAIKNTGPSERIREGIDGFCLDDSENAFADKIQELYNMKINAPDEFLKLKNNAVNQIVLSWDEVAKQYLEIYEELLTKNKC